MASSSSTNTRVSRSQVPRVEAPPPPVYCICRTPDEEDRPMIACEGGCDDWFHWDCVQLDETSYEDIIDYICPACEISTGLKTTREDLLVSPPDSELDSETAGPDGEASASGSSAKKSTASKKKTKTTYKDDEYNGEDHDHDESTTPSKRASTSAVKASAVKASAAKPKAAARRTSSSTQPFVAIPSTPATDPARKTCLEGIRSVLLPLLGADEARARAYATQLEELVWVGEEGATTTGRKKYQDRMRSLRFNVSKADRTELRSGIADGSIPPERLSQMNSNDLANPTAQALYSAATAASLALRTLPASSDAAPLIVHNHKGIVEVSDARAEMAREEEEQHRQEELERLKRKRERDYEDSAIGLLERSSRASVDEDGAAKRRRSESGAEGGQTMVPHPIETDASSLKALDALASDERGGLDPDFAMEFNEFLTDDAILGTTTLDNGITHDADVYEPVTGGSPYREPDGGGSPFRGLGDADEANEDDQAIFDFFVDEPKYQDVSATASIGKTVDSDVIEPHAKISPESKAELAAKLEAELLGPTSQTVWSGEIINPDAPQPGTLRAVQIGGPLVAVDSFASILLPKQSNTIMGRVPIDASRKFLLQAHLTPSKELVVVAFEGENAEGQASATAWCEFLKKRGRDAFVQPHDKNALPPGGARDMYIVALAPSDPLPEFLEIMDTNRLPSARTKEYLLGVFVRTKVSAANGSRPKSSRSQPDVGSSTPPSTLAPLIASTHVAPSNPSPVPPASTPAHPAPTPTPAPPTAPLPIPAIDSNSIASLLAQLSGVIPTITSPHPALQPPPQPSYHLPSAHHPVQPPPSSHSPYHQPNPPPPQEYQPSPAQPYVYHAPPPPGPGWYSGPPPPSLPSNGFNGSPGGYPPPGPPHQQQSGPDRSRGGGHDSGGGGGRGGRGSWEPPIRGGGDQGWGRRGGRGA